MTKLALHGGDPIRTKPFPQWPRPTSDLKDAIIDTLENEGWGVGSRSVSRFEEKFAEFRDAKYCISTSSGTAALWVILKAAGVKAGDEVIVPPYTFIATASAVLMANAVPIFVDIDYNTFNIDANLIEAAITEKTKAIMPVHISGNPADMNAILAIGQKYDIPIPPVQVRFNECIGCKVCARVCTKLTWDAIRLMDTDTFENVYEIKID